MDLQIESSISKEHYVSVFRTEDSGSMFVLNAGICLQVTQLNNAEDKRHLHSGVILMSDCVFLQINGT